MIENIFITLIIAVMIPTILQRADMIALWIIKHSVRLLPSEKRNELHEQWSADAFHVDGSIYKIYFSLGLFISCAKNRIKLFIFNIIKYIGLKYLMISAKLVLTLLKIPLISRLLYFMVLKIRNKIDNIYQNKTNKIRSDFLNDDEYIQKFYETVKNLAEN